MHIFAQTRFLEVTITKGGIIMKKRIIILASVFLLTGCSGNTPSDDAPDVTNASSLSNLSGESSQGTPGASEVRERPDFRSGNRGDNSRLCDLRGC